MSCFVDWCDVYAIEKPKLVRDHLCQVLLCSGNVTRITYAPLNLAVVGTQVELKTEIGRVCGQCRKFFRL